MRSAPQSWLFAAISLINVIVSSESLGFLACALDVCFQNTRKSSRWKPQQRLRLDKEKGLIPGSNHPGQEHQKKPVPLSIHRAFDLSMQDEQLMSQQRVFRQQFGFASGHVGECTNHKGGRQWFDPRQNTFLERMEAERDALLDRGKYTQHEWNLFFVKIGAWSERMRKMDRVDCRRISHTLARKLAPS
jgi:hypothetical protein